MDNKKNDHVPVCLDAVVVSKKVASVSRRRKPEYDRRAVRDARLSKDHVTIAKVEMLNEKN